MAPNPEFRRYCWLELTPHRVIAIPVIASLIIALVYASADRIGEALATTGLVGFALCALAWGGYHASNATPEEVRDRTWDVQRMAALTPAQLAFGKVFGAPVAGWYAGAWFLAAYLVGALPQRGLDALLIAATAVASTLALHAAAVMMGTLAARAGQLRSSGIAFLVLLVWTIGLPAQWLGEAAKPIVWWGANLPALWFLLFSAVLFAAWAWLGAARTFATDLRVRQLPWAWPAFCLYLGVWAGGLADAKAMTMASRPALVVLLFFIAIGVGAYGLVFSERTGAVALARVLRTARGEIEGGLTRVLQGLPLWSVSLACAWVAAILLLVLPWGSGTGGALLSELTAEGKQMPLALAAMLLRDCGLYCIFALTRQPRRPGTVTLVYLVLIDGILPGLLHAAQLKPVAMLVMPFGTASAAGALVIFLIHAALAWAIAWKRWQTGQRPDPGAA